MGGGECDADVGVFAGRNESTIGQWSFSAFALQSSLAMIRTGIGYETAPTSIVCMRPDPTAPEALSLESAQRFVFQMFIYDPDGWDLAGKFNRVLVQSGEAGG